MLIYTLVHVCAFKYIPKETQGAQRDIRVSAERHTILVRQFSACIRDPV